MRRVQVALSVLVMLTAIACLRFLDFRVHQSRDPIFSPFNDSPAWYQAALDTGMVIWVSFSSQIGARTTADSAGKCTNFSSLKGGLFSIEVRNSPPFSTWGQPSRRFRRCDVAQNQAPSKLHFFLGTLWRDFDAQIPQNDQRVSGDFFELYVMGLPRNPSCAPPPPPAAPPRASGPCSGPHQVAFGLAG